MNKPKVYIFICSTMYLSYLNYEISVTVCLFHKMDAQRQTRWSVNVKFVIDGVVFEEFFDNCTLNSRRRALCVSSQAKEREVKVRVKKFMDPLEIVKKH